MKRKRKTNLFRFVGWGMSPSAFMSPSKWFPPVNRDQILNKNKTKQVLQLKKKDMKFQDAFKFTKKRHHFSQVMSILGIYLQDQNYGLKALSEPDNFWGEPHRFTEPSIHLKTTRMVKIMTNERRVHLEQENNIWFAGR